MSHTKLRKDTINQINQLPILDQKERIIQAIRENQVVIIAGDTGSGKTTQIPKFCLAAGRGKKKLIGCTQPRRVAATAMAARVAEELSSEMESGSRQLVGYKIRFRNRTDRRTRIKFMTDGILLAETLHDRHLNAYDTLIIDEAHERSLNIDFILGYVKRLITKRKDLKVVVTSATIDTEKFSKHFNDAPVIEVTGRTYPVEVRYNPFETGDSSEEEPSYIDRAVEAISGLCRKDPGDILVFMPTERDIRETVDSLNGALKDKTLILPMFGRLQSKEQQRIFKTSRHRKIVVATNIAETSLTVPGIRYVVDTGLARISMYNVRQRTTSLPVLPVSQASCNQRKGRCGRTGPGMCIRLYSEESYNSRPEYTLPEIKRSNLTEVILRMISLKLGDPAEFQFIDPPSTRAIKDGYTMLIELGALETLNGRRKLTDKGKLMARLPFDPRLARLIIEAQNRNALSEIVVIASALAIQDPRSRPAEKEHEADAAHEKFKETSSDFLFYLNLWNTYSKLSGTSKIRKFCRTHYLSYQRMREWRDIHEQICIIIKEEKGFSFSRKEASYDAIHQSILSGFLRNIALKKRTNIYQGTRGKEVMIFPGSKLFKKAGQWVVAAELVETSNLYARIVANINKEWLEHAAGSLCRSNYSNPRWEKNSGRVVADEKVTLFGLIIVPRRKVNYSQVSASTKDESRKIFIQSALVEGELKGKYSFLKHNLQLVGQLEGYENRLRQRGMLVDDFELYRFYEDRLPGVYDQNSLNRLLKKKGSDVFLKMTDDDIQKNIPEHNRLEDFPKKMNLGDFSLKLAYKFTPGSEDDGISVPIPANLVQEINPSIFEWLVPGLLHEKITSLLKGLPKNIRKKLIPIPQTAAEIFHELKIYEGSLLGSLEHIIFKKYRVEIKRNQWPLKDLPEHLKIRFILRDSNDKISLTTRSFDLVKNAKESEPSSDLNLKKLKEKWERKKLTEWDFDGLPEKISLESKQKQLRGFAYPTLIAGENNLSVKLFTDLSESRNKTRKGLLELYRLYFPKQIKHLQKECRLVFKKDLKNWSLSQGISGHDKISEDINTFIQEELFESRNGIIPKRNAFFSKIERLKKAGVFSEGMKILDEIVEVLKDRQETIKHITRYENSTAHKVKRKTSTAAGSKSAEFNEEINQILPADFTSRFTFKRLHDARRYLQALRIRIERAHASPQKDAQKAAVLQPFLDRLDSLKSPEKQNSECCDIIDEYEHMLQEYKVSLFAQELKTAYPVSIKRLENKWQKLISECC